MLYYAFLVLVRLTDVNLFYWKCSLQKFIIISFIALECVRVMILVVFCLFVLYVRMVLFLVSVFKKVSKRLLLFTRFKQLLFLSFYVRRCNPLPSLPWLNSLHIIIVFFLICCGSILGIAFVAILFIILYSF